MIDRRLLTIVLAAVLVTAGRPAAARDAREDGPAKLVPKVPGWTLVEPPRAYIPATLFEYIDGAAESYLSYGFEKLAVADYKSDGGPATLTAEIYDMAGGLNAFGIYSSERYPESRYLEIGAQGYYEEGTLNFFVGRYYVKLMCFDCPEAESGLTMFARDIEKRHGPDRGGLPAALSLFPKEGLAANSEKYVRHNVLGYGFLHDGYLAGYRPPDQEFDLFLIVADNEAEAGKMLTQYLAAQAKNGSPAEKSGPGYHIKDRYAQNVFLASRGRYLAGAMKLKPGGEAAGVKALEALLSALGK